MNCKLSIFERQDETILTQGKNKCYTFFDLNVDVCFIHCVRRSMYLLGLFGYYKKLFTFSMTHILRFGIDRVIRRH